MNARRASVCVEEVGGAGSLVSVVAVVTGLSVVMKSCWCQMNSSGTLTLAQSSYGVTYKHRGAADCISLSIL